MSGGTDDRAPERALPTVSQPALDLLRSGVISIATRALSPLSDEEREMVHRESWFTILRRDHRAFKATLAFEETIERLRKTQLADGTVFIQEAALMECLHYLVWFEGPLNTRLGEVCFLGVRGGTPFLVKRDSDWVQLVSPQEIMDASVSLKAGYLRSNQVRLPQGVCETKLRNAVAHMDIELTEDGSILYWPRLSEQPEHTNIWKLQRQVWAVRDVCITIQKAVADTIGQYSPP